MVKVMVVNKVNPHIENEVLVSYTVEDDKVEDVKQALRSRFRNSLEVGKFELHVIEL